MADDPAIEAAATVLHAPCVDRWESQPQFNWDRTMHAVDAHYDRAAAVVAAVRPVLAREAFNQAAEAIEAAPTSHFEPIMDYCEGDDDCRPCPGHDLGDRVSMLHGRDFYAAAVRGLGGEQ
jgi:hypothetical protein